MSKKSYGELEQHIIDVFKRDHIFTYQKKLYEVQTVGKPRPQGTGGNVKRMFLLEQRNKELKMLRI